MTDWPEICSTCSEPYSQPSTPRASVCSNSFHCCRDCTWVAGQRTKLCPRHTEEEASKVDEPGTIICRCGFKFFNSLACPKCNVIPKASLIKGHVYTLHSRNLDKGVFDGDRGFVGIREKFGDHYLFREFYADKGPFGTAVPRVDLGPIPEGMEIKEYNPDEDSVTGRPVGFDKPIAEGGRGWYFLDTGESSTEIRACCSMYRPLFEYLEGL